MQPATDKESQHASIFMKHAGTWLSYLSHHGAQFQTIALGSRSYTYLERTYNFFIGKTACDQCSIGKKILYLLASIFRGSVTIKS